jgi:DNA invertase Pin-like site-specific DNA recombinase
VKPIAYAYTDPLFESPPDATIWGYEVKRVYQDLGDRSQWQQLLHDCQTEPQAYLLVRQLAELGDSVAAVRDRLTELEALGIHLIAMDEAIDSPDQPLKRADLLQLLMAMQTTQRSRRIQQGHARNRVKALPPPGKAPYGYRRGKDRYAIDRSTAPVVKEFFDHFLLYGSLRGSVRFLEKKYGKKISASTGKRWLTSPVYRGDLAYQNGKVVPDTHLPILSRPEAAQIDRLLRRNRRMPARTASAPRSLSGLVTCAHCQSQMTVTRVTARRQRQEYLYLRPVACTDQPKCGAIPYQQVLEQTIQRICTDLPNAVAQIQAPDLSAIQQEMTAQITAKQSILSQLPALTTSGILDTETADLRAYKVRTEIASLQASLAQLPPVNLLAIAQTVSIPQFWLDLSESERRFYFREFIQQIQIDCRRDRSLHQESSPTSHYQWQMQLVFVF